MGRIAPWKGQDLFLRAFARAFPDGRERAVVIGDALFGEEAQARRLRSLAAELGIADRVEFRGHDGDVRRIWSDNQLLMMPSRQEGTPLALVEAMLCGRPAVVTDVGGNVEWVRERENGFVAEAPSVASFGAAMERAWHARDDWRTIGARAHDDAMRLHDPAPGRTLLAHVLAAAGGAAR